MDHEVSGILGARICHVWEEALEPTYSLILFLPLPIKQVGLMQPLFLPLTSPGKQPAGNPVGQVILGLAIVTHLRFFLVLPVALLCLLRFPLVLGRILGRLCFA